MCGPSCQQSCLPGCCDVSTGADDTLASQDQQVVIITTNPSNYPQQNYGNQPQVVYVSQQPYVPQGQQYATQGQPQVVYAQAQPVPVQGYAYGNNGGTNPTYAQTGEQPALYAKQVV